MDVFRQELTIAADRIDECLAHVLQLRSQILGFYTVVRRDDSDIELEHLFVEPGYFRQGLGSRLFRHAVDLATKLRFRRLVIQSDPHALAFYLAVGARLRRWIPSSIPGRYIPYLEFDLAGTANPHQIAGT